MSFVKKHADIQFLVLGGHTHTAVTIKLADNLIIKSGHAKYNQPEIQEIFLIKNKCVA